MATDTDSIREHLHSPSHHQEKGSTDGELDEKIRRFEELMRQHEERKQAQLRGEVTKMDEILQHKAASKAEVETPASRFFSDMLAFTTDCFVYGLAAGAGYAYLNRERLLAAQDEALSKTVTGTATVADVAKSSSGSGKGAKAPTILKTLTKRQRMSSIMLSYGTKFALNALLFGAPFFLVDYGLWKWQLGRDEHTMPVTDPSYVDLSDSRREEIAHRMWHRAAAGAFSGSIFGLIATFRDSMDAKLRITGYSAAAGACVGVAYALMKKGYSMAEYRLRGGYTEDEIGEVKRQMEIRELQRSIRDILTTEQEFSEKELNPQKVEEIQREFLEERAKYEKMQEEFIRRELLAMQMELAQEQERRAQEERAAEKSETRNAQAA